jgi:hypothetical protein
MYVNEWLDYWYQRLDKILDTAYDIDNWPLINKCNFAMAEINAMNYQINKSV